MKYSVTVGTRTVEVEVNGDEVAVDGRPVRATLVSVPRTPLRQLKVDGHSRTLALLRTDGGWAVQAAGTTWQATVLDERSKLLQELTGRRGATAAGGRVKAPMPGLVLRLEVDVGQRVEEGSGVVVLEAMKMENEIKAPGAGVVRAIHVRPGEAVEKGAPLVDIGEEA